MWILITSMHNRIHEVHARECATCALIIMSMRCDDKNSQILAIFVEFLRAYDRAGRVWVENVVFPRNVRVHTNKDRGCLILVVKCIFVRHQN